MSCEIDKSTIQATEQMARKLDLPEGVPPLTSLYMYISGSCNLACRHCWIEPDFQAGDNGGKHIPLEYVEKAIREAKPLGLSSVKLTGGEPMLHPDFREIVQLIGNAGLKVHIETNGTLVDRAMAEFLRRSNKVKFISVSVDGVDAETHERLRVVPGCYDRAITGIRNLVSEGFHPQLICTLHRGNVPQVAEIIDLAQELGCGSVKFNHIQQVGRGESFEKENRLVVQDVIGTFQSIQKDLAPKAKISVFFDIPFAFHSIGKLLKGQLGRCNIMNILGVLAGGELSICGMGATVPELVYGNLSKDSLRDIWFCHPTLVGIRELIPLRLEGVCAECIHKNMCLGHCVAFNFHVAGKLNAGFQFCQKAEEIGAFPGSRKTDGFFRKRDRAKKEAKHE